MNWFKSDSKKSLIMHKIPIIIFCFLAFIIAFLYLTYYNVEKNIILQVRLPRLILTLFTGMSLAAIGSIYQLMLSNPLAEPYILGISSGAAVGSVIAGLLGMFLLMPFLGFLGAFITMILVWTLAQKKGQFDKTRLLLSGIIIGIFLSAMITLIMYLLQKDTLLILGILMGNLGHIFSPKEYLIFLICVLLGLSILSMMYRDSITLDVLCGGDLYATSVGIDAHRIRQRLFFLSSLLTGIVVSFAGIIGFVGLIIPHIVRFTWGASQKHVYPISLLIGGIFLLVCDFIAMHLTTLELPVGIITAFLGCPFFIWLILSNNK